MSHMSETLLAETIFIAAMMVLILIFGIGAVYIFFRQYKKEMREKAERLEKKKAEASASDGPEKT